MGLSQMYKEHLIEGWERMGHCGDFRGKEMEHMGCVGQSSKGKLYI